MTTTTITLPRAVVEQALEAMRCAVPTGKITLYEWDKAMAALRVALAQQAEPVELVESALQAVAEKIGDQCAVWYGIGARDVEEVLREAARYGLVHGTLAEPVLQTCNCRWDGEVQVQQCTLHEAHVDAIHEWAERAKVAERKLAQQAEPVEPAAWVGDPSTQDYASTVPDPQIEDRLARHGIPMPGDPSFG